MAVTSMEALKEYKGCPIEVKILDLEDQPTAPTFQKTLWDVCLCPDTTHIRFHFDETTFIAVPIHSKIEWTYPIYYAVDTESNLSYQIKVLER
ncbi:hypothetical protein [Ammoniphilus resinae]|uniref:Uncharacterized protein n=1 Tax=Ammoniphilus resinae TaxID=861532 RepID=A0ABS4GWD5_9BACL|nr:hypothetical protein [Ammoniphilus resinae]MBP1934584.1 hypothetical protein [Ammoniphilus resinae]